MKHNATTIDAYMKGLPEDRRAALEALRKVINKNIDKKFEEGMQYGMPAWYVPHSIYPAGYHCDPKQPLPFASIASQKNHMAMYLFCIYMVPGSAEQFAKDWKATGKKLDMGKACIRFKKIEDVPLDVVGNAIKRATLKQFLEFYESAVAGNRKQTVPKKNAKKAPATKKKSTVKKVTKKAATAKKPITKKKMTTTARKKVGTKK
jgi:hypothetical protein